MKRPMYLHHQLLQRARRVVPGGIYGHGALVPHGLPQLFDSRRGARITDVDGNEYIDFMCGFGPNLLGMSHPRVQAAAQHQRERGDCFSGPTEQWVLLAETLVERIRHAGWAMFTKNGTDATTLCLTLARAASGRRKILVAEGAYHGAAPWCTPSDSGVLTEDRAHLLTYTYNDLDSVRAAAAQAGEDLAAIVASPFKHDTFVDQELPTPQFACGVRALCDHYKAHLILDEVRAGFRTCRGGSWEHLGIDADLSAWGKALGNGYAISAVTGTEELRDAVANIYATGSFWYGAVAMAAAVETLSVADDIDLPTQLHRNGNHFRDQLGSIALDHGFSLRQTGPPAMPLILFDDDDPAFTIGTTFSKAAADHGVYFHPFHNMFLSAAHEPDVLDEALLRLDDAFTNLRATLPGGGLH